MPATRSKKNNSVRKTRKSSPKKRNNNTKSSRNRNPILSVNGIKKRFADLEANIRQFIQQNRNKPQELAKHVSRQWSSLFKANLSTKAANTLANHFSKLHNKKGGSHAGAPLDYVMRPGLPGVSTYGVFPTEVGADPKSVGHLDVYYNSGLARSCGSENTTAQVPASMGSNLVAAKGGARRTRGGKRNKRGGNFMLAAATRSYIPDSPASGAQMAAESSMGQAPWGRDNPDATNHTWKTVVGSGPSLINPNSITSGFGDITNLANKSPYPAVKY